MNSVLSKNIIIDGIKTFSAWPSLPMSLDSLERIDLTKYSNDIGNVVPNIRKVNDMLQS